jgi:hypothetical protein
MTAWPAYQEITLAHRGNTLRLRPSLRAAASLERLHGGFPALFRRVDQFDTATIRAVILSAATDQRDARKLIESTKTEPLSVLKAAAHGPVSDLCRALIPAADAQEDHRPAAKPMAWADVYKELFRVATGWLQWTPDAAWNATPDEITTAFDGMIARLKAVHGAPDEIDADAMSQDQRAENLDLGLDPDFDRAGLHALKARIGGNA